MLRQVFAAALAVALAGSCAMLVAADPSPGSRSPAPGSSPLHVQIDSLIESAAIGPLAPICSDADFVRRVYLDLTDVIPTSQQARNFVADSTGDKRQRLIDELLASPAFLRHMTITLDVMLMERKPEKVVKQPEWETYLYKSLAENKPLDQLFRELIAADGADEALRPAAKFTLDRDAEPNLITRDIGRLAFGMDLQCCQCHDHPLIDDYYQDDYYGLFAFVHRSSLFTDVKTKLISLTEKADGEASFKSVFTGASSDKALPRLPKGAVLFVEPSFAPGTGYIVAPDKTIRGVPKFSRRAALAEMVPSSREFSRNMVNRLWATMFGRGIVHPLDFHYAANPPANPRLLSLLADELAAERFQLRPFIRELTLTRAYQRSCDAPRPDTVNFADIAARHAQLLIEKASQQKSIEPLKDVLAKAKTRFKAARDSDAQITAELPPLEKSVADARQAMNKVAAEHRTAEDAAKRIRDQSQAIAQAAARLNSAALALPDDRVLADAAATISARSNELGEIADAAAKAVSQQSSGEADAAEHLANAESALAAAMARRPTSNTLRKLEQAQLSAQHQLSDAQYAAAQIDTQIATAKAIGDYALLATTDPVKAQAAWVAIVEKWTIYQQVAALKPLTPEQLAASAMQATGAFAPQLAAVEAKLDKSPPDALKNAAENDKPRLRSNLAQLDLLTQLRGTFGEFIRQYGGLPGEEFQATVNQALFIGNGGTIDGWLRQKGNWDGLVARLLALRENADLANVDDIGKLTDELYFSVLSRGATETEKSEVAKYFREGNDKVAAISELAWALLSSTEFRFNH